MCNRLRNPQPLHAGRGHIAPPFPVLCRKTHHIAGLSQPFHRATSAILHGKMAEISTQYGWDWNTKYKLFIINIENTKTIWTNVGTQGSCVRSNSRTHSLGIHPEQTHEPCVPTPLCLSLISQNPAVLQGKMAKIEKEGPCRWIRIDCYNPAWGISLYVCFFVFLHQLKA